MKKISTLFKKDPIDLSRVINEINPENKWVFTDEGVKATRKFDGTACAIINGQLYKRYDVKKGKTVPHFAIPCQEPDVITGHWPHWVLCQHDNQADKVQGNPEKIQGHHLVKHGEHKLMGILNPLNFENLKEYLSAVDIEGIVFHHPDGRMCKLRKSDFGFKR